MPNLEELSRGLSDFFSERTLVAMLAAGLLILLIGYFWLARRAVATSKWWRIGYLPPLALLYLLSFSKRVITPLITMAFGALLLASPFLITHYVVPLMPRHSWERVVDGERHLTLTGISGFDYSRLDKTPDVRVLQMANPDVTDETLAHLKGLTQLRELDLNDAKITDAGLIVIAELPNLEKLRIARTGITDQGFNERLANLEKLASIDATGTEIKSSSLRKWKNAKEGRAYLK